ncbi:MAG: DUF4407 domain-containing protein [Saprospiraceae bacterium]|nr:DUF4407 domain-containing protein [Saprospiraceae bacterium]
MMLTIISLIIGLSPIVLSKLHPSIQQKLFSLSFLLIFVPVVSALLGTLSFSQVIDFNFLSGSAFFLGWFTTIYVIDRALIHLTGSDYAKFLRIAIGVLFGLLHGLLLDSFIFRDDINLILEQRQKTEIKNLEKQSAKENAKVRKDIKELQAQINDKENFVAERRREIFLEIDGQAASGLRDCGPVCIEKKRLLTQDSTAKYGEIALIREQIKQLQNTIEKTDSLTNTKISTIPNYREEVGLKTRLDIAHDILFTNGSLATRMIAIVLFFLAVIFEQLILIFKDYLGVKEYKEVEKRLTDHNDTYNITVDENDLTLLLQREAYRLSKISNELNTEASRDTMKSKIEAVRDKLTTLNVEFNYCDEALKDVLNSDSYFKEERETSVKDAVEEISRL